MSTRSPISEGTEPVSRVLNRKTLKKKNREMF